MGFKGIQGVTRCYRGLEGLQGVKRGHWELHEVTEG